MLSLHRVYWRSVAAVFIALLVTGCAPRSTSAPSTHTVTITDNLPPCPTISMLIRSDGPSPGYCPIVLQDTSPGQLAFSLNLMIGGYDASTRDMTELNVTFTHQGQPVQFVAGEQVSCNGLVVPGFGSNFNLKASSAVFSGKLVTCTYTSGTTSATFTFTCPLAPTILSPHEHAQVTRSAHTPITYRLSPDWAFYVIALDPPQKAWTPTAPSQSNPVMLDTSDFPSGSGSIAINQSFTLSDLHAPDFQAAQGQGNATYEIQVNWV